MKKDFAKILVERPRFLGRWYKEHPFKGDFEEAPLKEGMRPKSYDRKQLNENLQPLRRYLKKNVGRSWDKVFSEICKHINVNSTVQNHIREHLKWEVHQNVVVENGKVFRPTYARYGGEKATRRELNEEFYVHPVKKTLELSPRRIFPSTPVNSDLRKISDKNWLIREKGIWYWVSLDWKVDNRFLRCSLFEEQKTKPWIKYKEFFVYDVVDKVQLSKKALKRYGLR